MPVVPTYDIPRQQLQPGLNTRNTTQANGSMFGAGIGEALQGVGKGIADVGQAFDVVAQMDAQTEARDAVTGVMGKIKTAQYGDGESGGYLGLEGKSAVDGYQGYTASVDKTIADGGAQLSPRAQKIYNEQVQSVRLSALQSGTVHSFEQRKAWYVQSTANELDQYSNIYIDPAQSETERAQAGANISRIIDDGEKSGQFSPQQAEAFRNKFVDGSNLTYAKLYVDSNKELYAPTGDAVQDTATKIIHAESGGNPNAQNPNSSASGLGGFTNGTWLSTVRTHRPDLAGKSDAELLGMKGDPSLGREMTIALTQDNANALRSANLPVTEGNLYLAHFAGSDGAEKVLRADPTAGVESVLGAKVVAANPFLQGKTAAWLQTWANLKMNRLPSGPLPPNFSSLKPDQKQAVLDDIENVANDQKVYVRSIIQNSVDNAPVAIQSTGSYNGTLPTAQQFIAAYGPEGQQKYDAFSTAIDTGKNIYAMRNMSNNQISDLVKAAVPSSSGDNAELETKRYNALSSAAASIIEQRKSDPVGYVQKAFPSVNNAWKGVSSGGVSVQDAIKQTVAAQQQIGIDPQDIQPLPKTIVDKAVATFKSDMLDERQRANAVLGALSLTNDPDQQAAIYRDLVKAGLPEYVGGAVRAAMRGDQAAASRLMSAAMADPSKIPGELTSKESDIKEQIQSSLMSEGAVGDVFYGLSSGNLDGVQRAADDATLLTRAVQMRLRTGESLADAVDNAGKDLYGDVQRVTGDSRVQTNILLPTGADPKPVLDGLAASKLEVYNSLKTVADKAVEQATTSAGAKAIVREASRNRIEDIMTNGYFVRSGKGYAFFDPYLGQPVSDAAGKPLIFDDKTIQDRAKASPSPGAGELGAGLDPVARKMMGLDLMPQDAWKPMGGAQ